MDNDEDKLIDIEWKMCISSKKKKKKKKNSVVIPYLNIVCPWSLSVIGEPAIRKNIKEYSSVIFIILVLCYINTPLEWHPNFREQKKSILFIKLFSGR